MSTPTGVNGRRVLLGFFGIVLTTMGVMLASIYAGDGPMWADDDDAVAEAAASSADDAEPTPPEDSQPAVAARGEGPPYRIHVGVRCAADGPREISVHADAVALERAEVACTPDLPDAPQYTLWFERGETPFVLRVHDDTGEHAADYEVYPSADTWVTVSHRVLGEAGFTTTFATAFAPAW